MLRVFTALNNFTIVCNVISVLVEVVTFPMVIVDMFSKYILITAFFTLFDGKDARFVVYESELQTDLSN